VLLEFKNPQDEFGHLTYSLSGKTFAQDKSGNEYILLQDNSIGYWGCQGETGRIADNLTDFFVFIINCPYWKKCINKLAYKNIEIFRKFFSEVYEEYIEEEQEYWDDELRDVQKELAEKILMKFYSSATRFPRLIATYIEDDSSQHSNSGSLFETE
jgi:hypothetical protein